MSTLIARQGGNLKITVDSNEPKYLNLNDLEVSLNGDYVRFEDGSEILYSEALPTVASAEILADSIGIFIYEYNTGV